MTNKDLRRRLNSNWPPNWPPPPLVIGHFFRCRFRSCLSARCRTMPYGGVSTRTPVVRQLPRRRSSGCPRYRAVGLASSFPGFQVSTNWKSGNTNDHPPEDAVADQERKCDVDPVGTHRWGSRPDGPSPLPNSLRPSPLFLQARPRRLCPPLYRAKTVP